MWYPVGTQNDKKGCQSKYQQKSQFLNSLESLLFIGRGEIYPPSVCGGFECAGGAQAALEGCFLLALGEYPPLAGSDSYSSSHLRPWPDFRNFSRFLAELWSWYSSVSNTTNSPRTWLPFDLLERCSLRRLLRSFVIPTYRLPVSPFKTYKVTNVLYLV